MIQRADDDPVDAGRIMVSPGHGGWMIKPGIKPDLSNFYNAKGGGIAGSCCLVYLGASCVPHKMRRSHTSAGAKRGASLLQSDLVTQELEKICR